MIRDSSGHTGLNPVGKSGCFLYLILETCQTFHLSSVFNWVQKLFCWITPHNLPISIFLPLLQTPVARKPLFNLREY